MNRPPDPIDRALAGEPALVPSPGFTARVMRAVRHTARAPLPLPFPWKRFAAAAAVFATCIQAAGWTAVLGADRSASTELGPPLAAALGSLAVLRFLTRAPE